MPLTKYIREFDRIVKQSICSKAFLLWLQYEYPEVFQRVVEDSNGKVLLAIGK
jgi:hypothetical protein